MAEIETLGDWNVRMGCCCRMPSCPVPTTRSETISLSVCGFAMPEFAGMTDTQRNARYEKLDISRVYHEEWNWHEDEFSFGSKVHGSRTVDHDYRTSYRKSNASGFCSSIKASSSHTGHIFDFSAVEYPESSSYVDNATTYNENWSATGGENESATGTHSWSTTGTDEYGEPVNTSGSSAYNYSGMSETSYISQCEFQGGSTFRYQTSSPADPEDFYKVSTSETITRTYSGLISVLSLLAGKKFPDDATASPVLYSEFLSLSGKRSRFQFVIPSNHLGTWFKVSWDWLNEPEGWNATIPDPAHTGPGTPPQIPKPGRPKRTLETGGTWTWAGPGSQSDPTGNSWKSPWIEIPVPAFKGRRKRVNLRFECYRGPYGTKPQVSGEAIDESEL